ncbi:MAG: sigma-70 family RNA polymerase sigma factor [Lentisphaeraceae bacterium]|nr:sigma-70 family RNA polymerase sigma factor [Lentisphaeraceae bacterium]
MSTDNRDDILREAFACQPKLIAYSYSMLRNHASAEDVVQNAYLVVVKKYEQFAPGTSMIAWCRAIVRLQVLSYIKKQKKEVSLEDQILNDAVDAAFEEFQSASIMVKHEYLRECMAKLPEKGRKTIFLRYMEKMGYEEIGQSMDMKLEAVRKNLFRVKQKLRECIDIRSGLEKLI